MATKKEGSVLYICFDLDDDMCIDNLGVESRLAEAEDYGYHIVVNLPDSLKYPPQCLGTVTLKK